MASSKYNYYNAASIALTSGLSKKSKSTTFSIAIDFSVSTVDVKFTRFISGKV